MLDLHFSHPSVKQALLQQGASLRFLAIVEAASVPLYLAAGPSLDVWTDNEATQDWLHHHLIDDSIDGGGESTEFWWESSGKQSQYGILLGVKDGQDGGARNGLEITEVLLYAAISPSLDQGYAPPSPPASSSPGREGQLAGEAKSLRLYALPLSSHIFKSLDQLPSLEQTDTQLSNEGCYLPMPRDDLPQLQTQHAPKRAKIETLFEDAAKNRRMQKKRGGGGVAQAMALEENGFDIRAMPSPSLPNPVSSEEKHSTAPPARTPLSRASTTGSLTSRVTIPSTARPQASRRPTLTNGPRSSLHRVESAGPPSLDGGNSPAPEDSTNDVENQNKTALSRVIMAGMRMYGFQPQRKKSVSSITTATETQSQAAAIPTVDGGPTTAGAQDEYKAVYHQTFKAASFVFRKHWARRAVGQEVLRDAVDGFLARFCQDPFAENGLDASSSFDGSGAEHKQSH